MGALAAPMAHEDEKDLLYQFDVKKESVQTQRRLVGKKEEKGQHTHTHTHKKRTLKLRQKSECHMPTRVSCCIFPSTVRATHYTKHPKQVWICVRWWTFNPRHKERFFGEEEKKRPSDWQSGLGARPTVMSLLDKKNRNFNKLILPNANRLVAHEACV